MYDYIDLKISLKPGVILQGTREFFGLSGYEMAKRIGIPHSYYWQLENDQKYVRLETLYKYMKKIDKKFSEYVLKDMVIENYIKYN